MMKCSMVLVAALVCLLIALVTAEQAKPKPGRCDCAACSPPVLDKVKCSECHAMCTINCISCLIKENYMGHCTCFTECVGNINKPSCKKCLAIPYNCSYCKSTCTGIPNFPGN